MNALNYLCNNGATAQPVEFEFDGTPWHLWPYDTFAIVTGLERFVVQFARQCVEKLAPAQDDDDAEAWQIYGRDLSRIQKDIQRGDYGAMMPDFIACIEGGGWPEALHRCIAYKEKNWTRDHTQRLLRDRAKAKELRTLWDELNYPKAPAGSIGPPNDQASNQSQSAGIDSCDESSERSDSSPAKLPTADLAG